MSQTVRETGEAGILKALGPMLRRQTRKCVLGTGDDVAVTDEPGARMVWTIDAMIEGTHFRWYDHPLATPEAVAQKLVASNVSDLASKGATARYGLLSIGVPKETEVERIERFYGGIEKACRRYRMRLIGGDTVTAPMWTLSLTAVGTLPDRQKPPARSAAEEGMWVYVTGSPGEAAAGLMILEGRLRMEGRGANRLVQRCVAPEARDKVGVALAREFEDLAMIDVSDGLVSDAGQIAMASKVQIEFDESARVAGTALVQAARALGREVEDFVYHGGEDYELLFCTHATPEEVAQVVRGADKALAVTRVGKVSRGKGVYMRWRDGSRARIAHKGYVHFG